MSINILQYYLVSKEKLPEATKRRNLERNHNQKGTYSYVGDWIGTRNKEHWSCALISDQISTLITKGTFDYKWPKKKEKKKKSIDMK